MLAQAFVGGNEAWAAHRKATGHIGDATLLSLAYTLSHMGSIIVPTGAGVDHRDQGMRRDRDHQAVRTRRLTDRLRV